MLAACVCYFTEGNERTRAARDESETAPGAAVAMVKRLQMAKVVSLVILNILGIRIRERDGM